MLNKDIYIAYIIFIAKSDTRMLQMFVRRILLLRLLLFIRIYVFVLLCSSDATTSW